MDLEAKAAFIRKILCFEAFKTLFSQFDRMLENKSLHEREAPLVWESAPLVHILALPVKNGPLPAKLKFRENTANCWSMAALASVKYQCSDLC